MSSMIFTPRAWAKAGVVAAASAMNSAHAGIIMTTNPIITPDGTTSPSTEVFTNSPKEFDVNQFDSTLGTLQAIELSFGTRDFNDDELGGQANLSACNLEGEGGSCEYAFGVTFDIESTLTTPDGTEKVQTASGSGGGTLDVENLNRAAGLSPSFNVTISGNSFVISLPLGLGTTPFTDYVGAGTWDLDFALNYANVSFSSQCNDNGISECSGSSGGSFVSDAFWNVDNIGVTYTYMVTEQVPAPGSLWLFGAGLAAASVVRRRKNRN
jgi:PEP-CTERM motif